MADEPSHVAWLKPTGEVIQTADGRKIDLVRLDHLDDQKILAEWANHYRRQYCADDELAEGLAATGLAKADYLTQMKFPDANNAPGPSTRAGDFAEILVADYIEFRLGFWCPKEFRYRIRDNPNSPTQGCDVLGFKFATEKPVDANDELFLIETKAGMTASPANRLQDAVNDSVKDKARRA